MNDTEACGIGLVHIEGTDTEKLQAYLWEKHRIITTPIKHPEFNGLRITPNVYTTLAEIDLFAEKVEETLGRGLTGQLSGNTARAASSGGSLGPSVQREPLDTRNTNKTGVKGRDRSHTVVEHDSRVDRIAHADVLDVVEELLRAVRVGNGHREDDRTELHEEVIDLEGQVHAFQGRVTVQNFLKHLRACASLDFARPHPFEKTSSRLAMRMFAAGHIHSECLSQQRPSHPTTCVDLLQHLLNVGTPAASRPAALTGPPLAVSSSEVVVNFNTDLFDGFNSDAFAQLAAENVFTANQSITGNLSVDGTLTLPSSVLVQAGTSRFLHNPGTANTFLGLDAGNSETTGQNNTASGVNALARNTEGGDNTASGANALGSNTTGSENTAIGAFAGFNLTTGSGNICVGNGGVAGESATIRVGFLQTRTFIAGIRGTTTGEADAIPVLIDSAGQLGTVSSSARFKEEIEEMGDRSSGLLQLRPVTFRYRGSQGNARHFGLVAEEVEKVLPELVVHTSDGEAETVLYHEMPAMLLNELQKQQRRIEALEARLAELEGALAETRASARQ